MFGSFAENFGLNLDAQGGLFGPNAPQQPSAGASNPVAGGLTAAPLEPAQQPPIGAAPAAPQQSPLASPLSPPSLPTATDQSKSALAKGPL